jgi:hypothetical protein
MPYGPSRRHSAGVADLVDDAALDFGLRKNGIKGIAETGQTVHAGDEDILNASILEVSDDTQPEISALLTIGNPMPQHIPMTFKIDAQDHMHGGIGHFAIAAQFDMDGVYEDDRIDGFQWPVLPGFYQLPDFVRDLTDLAGRCFRTWEQSWVRCSHSDPEAP